MSTSFVQSALRGDAYGEETVVVVTLAVVGGLVMVFIGTDWMRGGRHFDLSVYEE